jgi:hypothetical protein
MSVRCHWIWLRRSKCCSGDGVRIGLKSLHVFFTSGCGIPERVLSVDASVFCCSLVPGSSCCCCASVFAAWPGFSPLFLGWCCVLLLCCCFSVLAWCFGSAAAALFLLYLFFVALVGCGLLPCAPQPALCIRILTPLAWLVLWLWF